MLTHKPLAAHLFVVALLLLFSQPLKAQDVYEEDEEPEQKGPPQLITATKAVYVELSGNSDAYSINIDKVYFQSGFFRAAARIGIGSNLFFLPQESSIYPVIPVEATGLVGRAKKHFEFGLGYTHRFTSNADLIQQMYFARVGLRYQQPLGGLLIRVGATPFLSPRSNLQRNGYAVVPRFGFSVGYSF